MSRLRSEEPKARCFAIVPAAGRSVRLGQPKLLIEIAGRTLLERVLDAWLEGGVERVVVTIRRDDDLLAERCQKQKVDVVRPAIDPPDMKASVGEALRFVARQYSPTPRDAWLLAPADLPGLTAQQVGMVVRSHRGDAPRIVVPRCAGRRAHPVLFPWTMAEEVVRLEADQGINVLLARHEADELDLPEGAWVDDLDTPGDWERWQSRLAKFQRSVAVDERLSNE